jgi:hypothetical protein
MSQVMQGAITKPYDRGRKEAMISITFPLKGYGKVAGAMSFIKKIYKKSFLHDFQAMLTSEVA